MSVMLTPASDRSQ